MTNQDQPTPPEIVEAGREFEKGKIESYEFVKMGERLEPKPGVFVVDVGNNFVEGVADHHQIEGGRKSATGLLVENPQLVLGWHKKEKIRTITAHNDPDFDACASTFITQYLVEHGELPPRAQEIAQYADSVDYSTLKLGPHPEKSPYGIMAGIMEKTKSYWDSAQKKWIDKSGERMARGLELMQWISEHGTSEEAFSGDHPFKEEEKMILEDFEKYQEDREKSTQLTVTMKDKEGKDRQVDLAIVDRPKSMLFKDWFRNDTENSSQGRGFEYLMVVDNHPSGGDRYIISVAPDKGLDLKGLGAAIDEAETVVRGGKEGDERYKGEPRPGYNNSDPWYDGRAHGYTIIDTPRSGTKLKFEQMRDLVLQPEKWQGQK